MSTSELDSRNIAISMRKSVENLVVSSQDAIGQSISQALTFSGVIAQHTNQILQDTKSMSRSPSPSHRNSDTAVDAIDNDKDFCPGNLIEASLLQGGEMAIQVPCHAAGDSVSSASDSAPPGPKVTSPGAGARGAEGAAAGATRTKKKSWYNSLYPTYKSKSDDFKRLFKDLPDDERLIVDYSCALQKDILAHGRLYASQNYLCFYASIFGWETSMSLRWKDVTAITKEKTALVIPNAILVCTEGEKNFLTSFSGRDKAYLMLFRVWQNALMDQPMSSQEIWQWVHSCYGEELGFNSDDEGYSRDLPLALPLPGDAALLPAGDIPSEELLDSSMEAGGGAGGSSAGDSPRARTPRTPHARDCSPPLVTNGDAELVGAGRDAGAGAGRDAGPPTDMSDTSDSEPDKHHDEGCVEKCSSAHSGKLVMRQQFPFNIDQLFTMIFTNSKFYLELLAVRATTDYVQAPWQPQGGLKCRQVSYTLGLTSGPIGPKEVHVTETQVMNKCSKPGYLYSIDASSENTGIPYADYFTVEAHYCLQRVSEHLTDLSFYGHIKYKKTMWPMVKAFLEKNAMSGLEDYARLIEARLGAEAESAAPAARKRRHRRLTTSSQETVSAGAARAPRSSPWLPLALAALLALNALLYWRLGLADKTTRPLDMDDLQNRMRSVSGAQTAAWSALLEAHAQRQRAELAAWRGALDATVKHLAQTEQALRKLLETIKPSLEKAERDAGRDDAGRDDAGRDDAGRDDAGRDGTREAHVEL